MIGVEGLDSSGSAVMGDDGHRPPLQPRGNGPDGRDGRNGRNGRGRTGIVKRALARAFKLVPLEPVWRWAEKNVWLTNEMSAKPGPYSSDQTPWTRRLQELMQHPRMVVPTAEGGWKTVPVRRLWVKKCSQSGFSEACLNGIRWHVKHRPRNVIYAIDSKEEARNISDRLRPTIERLGDEIFTGDDDDMGTFLMRLRRMRIWFFGSFSSGKFANKFAPICIADEVEEHGKLPGDTDTLSNLESRAKTADAGFIIGLSKPKKSSGPITKVHKQGNCEEWFTQCPHCRERIVITFFGDETESGADFKGMIRPEMNFQIPFGAEVVEIQDEQTGRKFRTWLPLPGGSLRKVHVGKVRWDHCKDLAGQWDKGRILSETFVECGACKGRIEERQKPQLNAEAEWLPTAIGTPGVVSQRISDLYSMDAGSSWGTIVLEFLDAKSDRTKLMGWFNHRLGLDWKDQASEVDSNDVRRNLGAYRRGTIPWKPDFLILGSDVGMAYARWVVVAGKVSGELAVIDWGNEGSPEAVAERVQEDSWPEAAALDQRHKISFALMDAKYRKLAVQTACLATNGRMYPAMGGGSNTQRKPFTWNKYERGFPRWFGYLTFNDHDAKSSLYLDRYKKASPRIYFPADVFAREESERFVEEITKESLIEDEDGDCRWDDKHPNHYGDALKTCDLAFDYWMRPRRPADAMAAAKAAKERVMANG